MLEASKAARVSEKRFEPSRIEGSLPLDIAQTAATAAESQTITKSWDALLVAPTSSISVSLFETRETKRGSKEMAAAANKKTKRATAFLLPRRNWS
jgi:hypothetical protein